MVVNENIMLPSLYHITIYQIVMSSYNINQNNPNLSTKILLTSPE